MSKVTVTRLRNHHIGVVHDEAVDGKRTEAARQLDPTAAEVMQPRWTIVLTDRDTGDQILLPLMREGRDGLVNDLTGGIVLAGGELPRI